jgi:protein SCO1/2
MQEKMHGNSEHFRKALFGYVLLAAGLLLAFPGATKAEAFKCGSQHMAMMKESKGYTRAEKKYEIPDIKLVDMSNKPIRLRQMLDTDEPVLLQFIFATCTTICPVLSATFSAAQEPLNNLGKKYRMVSITIDPEEDTPKHLQEYAKRFKSGGQWSFLTGSIENIEAVEKAFKVYASNNKMYHQPYTFLRAHAGAPWVRVEGFMSASELVAEFQKMPDGAKRIP